jgi:hypothetical protein
MDEEYLKRLGLSIARGVPQMATGFVDLAALPFTMTGLLDDKDVVGSTAYLTEMGLLPPPQEGVLNETAELVSGAMSPGGALKAGLLGLGTMAGVKGGKSINQAIKTAQDEAMEIAQRNAALPIEEGGLGLPPNNTAMDRARALGFDVDNPMYHGTGADIYAFETKGKGKTAGAGAFFTDNPIVAETYVPGVSSPGGNIMPVVLRQDDLMRINAKGMNWNDLDTNRLMYGKKPVYSIFDELDPNSATSTDELAMLAKDQGFSGVQLKNIKDVGPNSHAFRMREYVKDNFGVEINDYSDWEKITGKQFDQAKKAVDKMYGSQKSTVTSIQEPSRVRSRFAAFDPMKRNLPDILAGVGATGIGLGLLAPTEEEQY